MSIRTRMLRKWRKNVFRYCTNVEEEILNKDWDDVTILPKDQWGYCVRFDFNGHHVSCPDDSWYGVYQGANGCINWIRSLKENQNENAVAE